VHEPDTEPEHLPEHTWKLDDNALKQLLAACDSNINTFRRQLTSEKKPSPNDLLNMDGWFWVTLWSGGPTQKFPGTNHLVKNIVKLADF
jgi:hypothetical protein